MHPLYHIVIDINFACGFCLQVSAMFAASLVISPALGTFILEEYPRTGMFNVVSLATGIAIMNLLFIIFIVPESLREGTRKSVWGNSITCEQADPFSVSHLLQVY